VKSLYYFETIKYEKLITKLNQNLIPTAPGLSLIFTYYNDQIGIYFLMDNMPNNVMIKWKKFRLPWYNKYKNITLYKLIPIPSFDNSEKVCFSEKVYYDFHNTFNRRNSGWINFNSKIIFIPTNFNSEERELMMKLAREELYIFPPEFITKEQVLLL